MDNTPATSTPGIDGYAHGHAYRLTGKTFIAEGGFKCLQYVFVTGPRKGQTRYVFEGHQIKEKPAPKVTPPKEEQTERVIFRVFKDEGDVIAIFPDWNHESGQTSKPGMVMSFEHVGQHGEASWPGLKTETRAATPAEYAAVKEELEGRGYVLKVEEAKPLAPWQINQYDYNQAMKAQYAKTYDKWVDAGAVGQKPTLLICTSAERDRLALVAGFDLIEDRWEIDRIEYRILCIIEALVECWEIPDNVLLEVPGLVDKYGKPGLGDYLLTIDSDKAFA